MVIVAVVVFNRFKNIQRWVKCWQQSNTEGAELVIIHNYYGDKELKKKFEDYCKSNSVRYIPRSGPGFDIGAFQDVCTEKIKLDFEYIIWCCDDTIPMSKDFITPFIKNYKEGIGTTCMQISSSVVPHVRTTGFCVSKEISLKIKFPGNTVTTKSQCYLFEHRGGNKTFTNQVREMGLSCVAVSKSEVSPLWDIGYWKRLDRGFEHESLFNTGITTGDKVVFICPIFEMYPQIISSLLCQTHKNWELILIYNGPCDNNLPQIVKNVEDKRIKFIEYSEATGKWGHVLRQWALKEMAEERLAAADYICITNADNYYTPAFISSLLSGFKIHTAVASYCESMVHSYTGWGVIPVRFERGFIDCGGVIVKKDIACEIGWRDTDSHSSDWTYFSDIANKYHQTSFIKVPGCLFVHN